MKKTVTQITLLCLALLFAQGSSASAVMKISAVPDDLHCKTDPLDKYEIGMRITDTSLSLAGKCINTKKFRAATVIEQNDSTIKVANFLHNNIWWTATIPTNPAAWKTAYFQILRFPVVKGVEAAHTEMRMVTQPAYPIELVSQQDPSLSLTVNDLVYSAEAAFPADGEYNFAVGALDNYPLNGRIMSGPQRLSESPTRGFEQYVLNFSANPEVNSQFIAKLVVAELKRSEEIGLNRFYNTIHPNCTSEAFDLLDEVKSRPKGVPPFYTVLSTDAIRKPSLDALEARNLSGRKFQVADMETEYPPYLSRQIPPPPANEAVGPLRESANMPFTLIAVMPKTNSSPQVAAAMKRKLDLSIGKVMLKLSSLALAPVLIDHSAESIVLQLISEVQREIKETLSQINNQLPDEANDILLYYAPWSGASAPISLVPYGMDANLPFNLAEQMSVDQVAAATTMKQVISNIKTFQENEFAKNSTTPIFLMGAGIRLRLQKDKSTIALQLVMGLTPKMLPFQTDSNVVDLTRVHLPNRASMIISNEQSYYKNIMTDNVSQEVKMDFGGLNGINTDIKNKSYGLFSIRSGLDSLSERPFLVPELQGKIIAQIPEMKTAAEKTPAKNGFAGFIAPVLRGVYDLANFATKGLNSVIKNRPMGIGIYSLKIVNGMQYCRNHAIQQDRNTAVVCKDWATAQEASGEPDALTAIIEDVDARVRVQVGDFEIAEPIDFFHIAGTQIKENGNESLDSRISEEIKSLKPLLIKTIMGAVPTSLMP